METIEQKGLGAKVREVEQTREDAPEHLRKAMVTVMDLLLGMADDHYQYANLVTDDKGEFNIVITDHPKILRFKAGDTISFQEGVPGSTPQPYREYLFPEMVSEE